MPTKLLLVEDDAALAGLIADYLRQNGFLVDIEPRGDLAAATIHATPPDLVILDLMLPGMDGFAVCRSVRERYTGEVIGRESLLESLRDLGCDGEDRSLDARVSRLRKKLDERGDLDRIKTVRSQGYLFRPGDSA